MVFWSLREVATSECDCDGVFHLLIMADTSGIVKCHLRPMAYLSKSTGYGLSVRLSVVIRNQVSVGLSVAIRNQGFFDTLRPVTKYLLVSLAPNIITSISRFCVFILFNVKSLLVK